MEDPGRRLHSWRRADTKDVRETQAGRREVPGRDRRALRREEDCLAKPATAQPGLLTSHPLLTQAKVRVSDSFRANRGIGTMARIDDGGVGPDQQLAVGAEHRLMRVRSGKINAADFAGQERVAGK